jgi:hypothetical protein
MTDAKIMTPESGAASPRKRSTAVTLSGIALLIVPFLVLLLVVISATPESPLAAAFSTGKFTSGLATGIGVTIAILAVFAVTGLAIVGRWRGWRIYAGTMGWFLILIYCMWLMTMPRMWRWNFDKGDAWALLVISLIAVLGIFILGAKREEPPARPFPVVTLAGALFLVIAIAPLAIIGAFFVAGTITVLEPAALITVLIVLALFGLIGLAAINRWRGWRIYAGVIAWLFIAIGILGGLGQIITLADRGAPGLVLLEPVGPALFATALGYFILWAKRQEPAPARRPQQS